MSTPVFTHRNKNEDPDFLDSRTILDDAINAASAVFTIGTSLGERRECDEERYVGTDGHFWRSADDRPYLRKTKENYAYQ